jgi:hypothetical protein
MRVGSALIALSALASLAGCKSRVREPGILGHELTETLHTIHRSDGVIMGFVQVSTGDLQDYYDGVAAISLPLQLDTNNPLITFAVGPDTPQGGPRYTKNCPSTDSTIVCNNGCAHPSADANWADGAYIVKSHGGTKTHYVYVEDGAEWWDIDDGVDFPLEPPLVYTMWLNDPPTSCTDLCDHAGGAQHKVRRVDPKNR